MPKITFITLLLATTFCLAINLYTWLLAYPLWQFAGPAFPTIHREYLRRLEPVITLPHVILFFASLAACYWRTMPLAVSLLILALNTLVIAVSIAIAGPIHTRFTRHGFDLPGLRRLLHVSAIRTLLLLTSTALLTWRLTQILR